MEASLWERVFQAWRLKVTDLINNHRSGIQKTPFSAFSCEEGIMCSGQGTFPKLPRKSGQTPVTS